MKLTVIIPVYNQDQLIVRALDSVPDRNYIETIVINDCSTDNTHKVVEDYMKNKQQRHITLLRNKKNRGVGYTLNRGLDIAKGRYVVLLGGDDYFYTSALETVLRVAKGQDLVYFNLKTNNGNVFRLSPKTKELYCGSVKLMRRDFIGNTRNPEIRTGEDWYFFKDLQSKKPVEIYSGITAKHYNYPRQNSLSWQARNSGKVTKKED